MNHQTPSESVVVMFDEETRETSQAPTSIASKFNLSTEAMTLVDDAMSLDRAVLMILPSTSRKAGTRRKPGPCSQYDFAARMQQVEKEVYG